jgi:hypothetical protein
MTKKLSRRDFLKLGEAVTGATVLASCRAQATSSVNPKPPNSFIPITPAPISCPPQPVCASPTPLPIPSPTPVSTELDLCSFYCNFRINGDPRCQTGIETITPLYGDRQDPYTMKMDIKWAREIGISTFVMPACCREDSRLEDWFLPASEPPFDINFALMFNAVFEMLNAADPSQISVIENRAVDVNSLLYRMIKHPRYKRLPDGRPVVFYFLANVAAYFFGADKLEHTAELLRSNLTEDIFLVGDLMCEPYYVQYSSAGYQGDDYVRRQVKAFDGITNYYTMRAGYKWSTPADFNHVVTPFQAMINGYDEVCAFWARKARQYGVKIIPGPMPTGFSNRLLYEARLDSWLVDRHEGVSYKTSKAMAEIGKKYADPDLKTVIITNWNELSEGAAIVPSVSYKFDPAHAVRDTFAIQPPEGWPADYYPPS